MPEGLLTAEGSRVDVAAVDQEFAKAMAAPEPTDSEFPSPPKKDSVDPEAPFGRTKDGKPKKAPGGRPPKNKAEQPRVTAPTKSTAPGKTKDYTQELTGVVQLGWGVLASLSPADAGALKISGPGMVTAWNNLAMENATVARGIEWLTTGSAYGAVVMATAPLIMQVLANHGRIAPESVSALGVHKPQDLIDMTAADVHLMQVQTQEQAA